MPSDTFKPGSLRLTLIIGFVLLSTVLVATGVSAPKYSGEETVLAGEYWHRRFEVESLNYLVTENLVEINYHFRVQSGPNVDFLLFTEENYTRYVSGENATYIPDFTWLNDNRAGGSPYLEPGVYYFVVDNSDFGEAVPEGQSVTFTYEIIYNDRESYQLRMLLIILVPAVVLVVILIVAMWLIIRHRSKRKELVKRL